MYPQTDALPEHLRLERILPGTRLHSGILIALALYLLLALFLNRSIFGFRLRAIGQGRQAAAFAGIPVDRYAHAAMILSGALGGLAGAVELSGVTYRLYESFPTGAGFTGIAVALLARLRPAAVLPAALLFGAIQAASADLQREMRISSAVAAVMQGSMILALMVIHARRVGVGAGPQT